MIKTLLVSGDTKFAQYTDWQKMYKYEDRWELIPDIEIHIDGIRTMQVNSLGCRGEEIDPNQPTIVFLGDSTTFSCSVVPEHWPGHVRVPGMQVLNAGIEGASMSTCRERFNELRKKVNVSAVVAGAGWHNLIYGESCPDYWNSLWDSLLGDHTLCISSIATALHDDCTADAFTRLLNKGKCRHLNATISEFAQDVCVAYFNFWSNLEIEQETIDCLRAQIDNYNRTARTFCRDTNSPFIDLHMFMYPGSVDLMPLDFYDVCHLRPGAYGKIGRFVTGVLRQTLCAQHNEEDMRQTIYPVW
jgi:hypothetical protein